MFSNPLKYHYSQTYGRMGKRFNAFSNPLKYHYSQTPNSIFHPYQILDFKHIVLNESNDIKEI